MLPCAQTLCCGNAVHDQLLQVTRASLRLVDAGTRKLRKEWRPPVGLSIDVAAASASQVCCGIVINAGA
jgi:DNA damage-binding protein 1